MTATSTPAPARGRLRALLAAKAVSDVGHALDFVCLSVFVWEATRSAFATGAVSVLLYAGAIVGGRLGHAFGDRWDRRTAMVAADLVRVVVLGLLAVLPGVAQQWWLFFAVFVVGAGRSVFEATLAAATPVLAGERVQFVNSVIAGLKGAAFLVGMGASALVVPLVGFRGVFALDAASYAVSAAVLLTLRVRLREDDPGPRAARAGVRAWPVVVAAGLVPLFALRALDAFGSSSQHVGMPILGGQLAGGAERVAGVLWSGWAAGLLLGGFVLRPLATRVIARAPTAVFCAATVLMSIGFIGVFWAGEWWLRVAAGVAAGIGDAFSEIAFKQAVQRLPDRDRGSVFGLSQLVVNAGFMGGLVVTTVVLQPVWVSEWVLLLHGIPLVAAVLLLFRVRGRR
ncbi:MFS transporter [Actinokineospora pegani]|uniref:MFS transporter n=1 Tax=Actinokineospora pegani TaxID=2654637 RepID=UPI0018D41BA8|nr:MFS transporter [Actinokineospora pegani]